MKPNAETSPCLIRCQGKRCKEQQCCSKEGSTDNIVSSRGNLVHKRFAKKVIIPKSSKVNLKKFTLNKSDSTRSVNEVGCSEISVTSNSSIHRKSCPETSTFTIDIEIVKPDDNCLIVNNEKCTDNVVASWWRENISNKKTGWLVLRMMSCLLQLRLCETSSFPPNTGLVRIKNYKELFLIVLRCSIKIKQHLQQISSQLGMIFLLVAITREKSCLQFIIPNAVFYILLRGDVAYRRRGSDGDQLISLFSPKRSIFPLT